MTFLDMIELYNIRKGNELDNIESIFADIDIDSRIDKSVMCGVILDRCGAMRCIYETTATFKYFSDNFFKKYKWNIGKMLDTLDFEYNPLTNYKKNWTETSDIHQNLDTTEGIEDSRTTQNTGTQSTTDTGTQTTADTGTQTTEDTGTQRNEYNNEEENTISAMNSSDYEPDNKKESNGDNTRTDNLNSTRTDNLNSTRTDNLKEVEERNNSREKSDELTWEEIDTHTESGNVNSDYQDLIEKERKIAEFNVYEWISKKYAKEMMLMIY